MEPIEKIFKLKSSLYSYYLDLENLDLLKTYNSLDLTIILYPFNKNINSKSFKFLPYEEYVKDLTEKKNTIYYSIVNYANVFFGIGAGVFVLLLYIFSNSQDFFNLQSNITALTAYGLAKELWKFVENLLINITYNLKLSFQEIQYSFRLRKQTTISKFSNLAKEKRYGTSVILPFKLDLIEESNSETLKIKFTRSQLKSVRDDNIQILEIKPIDENTFNQLKEGFMLAVKVSLNNRFLFIFNKTIEYFQAINNKEKGTIGEDGYFIKDTVRKKSVLNLGRFKYYSNKDRYIADTHMFI